jgi:hypothetical protein
MFANIVHAYCFVFRAIVLGLGCDDCCFVLKFGRMYCNDCDEYNVLACIL